MRRQKQSPVDSFKGFQIQLYFLLISIATSFAYAYIDNRKITDLFVLYMIKFFCITLDFALFLAIGYSVDFKRGMTIIYLFKIIVFLSLEQNSQWDMWNFMYKMVLIPFGLIIYYKLTLFLIIIVLSYVIEMEHTQTQVVEQQGSNHLSNSIIMKQQEQKTHLIKQGKQSHNNPLQPNSQTSQRIIKSISYHKQQQLYKKVQVFYFTIYFSTCFLILFPIQDYVIDYTKALSLSEKFHFLSNIEYLNQINREIINYVNYHSIVSILSFWGIFLIGEFNIKSKYPEIIKDYVLSIPKKFIIIQFISFMILFIILTTLSIGQTQGLNDITVWNLINLQIFGTAFLIHTLLPIFISFLFIRFYLGYIYHLNKFVSKKYSFHQEHDQQYNLDEILYDFIAQKDLNKVKYFKIDSDVLISRNKLKRYIEEEKLRTYVTEKERVQIQSLFEDLYVLDLYDKLSRVLAVVMFYISLFIYVLSLNVNDKYVINSDDFFPHKPAILLFVSLYFVNKYESSTNIFYPKMINQFYNRISEFLAERKSFNMIRLIHFYAIMFSIWIYRLLSQFFLPDHQQTLDKIKNTLYEFYSNTSYAKNSVMSNLLQGFKDHFLTNSEKCQYNFVYLFVDSLMLSLCLGYVLSCRYFYEKNKGEWNSILMILKIITPLYVFYYFIYDLECLDWQKSTFSILFCLGVVFMLTNQQKLKRDTQKQ